MKVVNNEFSPYLGHRNDVNFNRAQVRVVACHPEAEEGEERWPLGFVLGVLLSAACWAGLAYLVLR
ncbi:hypothetical protein [Novosphingobium album (ex Liu et al. 2023)]|uniref:Uncharacterized protein n=1 Tax=Novosphingobium album (ex Liu et al. 2023) TaxID=3031130 RepID=A0ABT5WUG4_9SPHN|nr:hypothetical protein [Novosphingobium album (ex Liu et al. 2023)]MDE8653553.1 hypothetical protein [Novosphingobium album (ex Liu et al. 2023)]